MSDEQLRELERRVRANPLDFALGHEFVRALERAGDTTRAFRERVLLARAGDTPSRRLLARLTPPRTDWAQGTRDGIARPDRARRRVAHVALEAARPWLAGATDDVVVLGHRVGPNTAIDLRDLGVKWTIPENRASVVWISGDGRILVPGSATSERGTVRVLDARTGGEVSSLTVPDVIQVGGEGADAVLLLGTKGGRAIAAWNLERLEQRWRFELPDAIEAAIVSCGRVYLEGGALDGENSVLEARDLATGDRIWTREFPGHDGVRPTVSVDARGIVFHYRDRIVAFDADTAADVRLEPGPKQAAFHASYERIAVVREDRIELLDIGSKRSLWRAPLRQSFGAFVVIAGEHAWVANLLVEPERVVVSALELASGLCVRRETVVAPGASHPELIALDGAIVMVARTRDGVVLLRLEEGGRASEV